MNETRDCGFNVALRKTHLVAATVTRGSGAHCGQFHIAPKSAALDNEVQFNWRSLTDDRRLVYSLGRTSFISLMLLEAHNRVRVTDFFSPKPS